MEPLGVLTGLYAGRPEHTPEHVDVLLERRGDMVAFVHDGAVLELHRGELRAWLDDAAAHVKRAA